ncbi:hypothetical protein GZ77_09700 [Endozoicomonas montiporae]|uniref:HTH marR-type domain-containing protein n=2 Tax=Endozoicomonas montiporae TaxID=1027273 RepID=A0A081N815_9GAMM|nr:MarR family transcriptional regulator [Endozoicomonas montiporae]KEQ14588.1 hypothetical protein GZ77_09700 [Endozoicomonas montiporae]
MDLNNSITYQITKCGALLRQLSTLRLRNQGLNITPEEATLLNQLWDKDAQSLSELGTWSIKEASTVTRQIDSLEKKGYINRVPDPQDGRKTLAKLTTTGKQLKSAFRKTAIHAIDETLTDISREELEITLSVLNRLKQAACEELQ